MRIHLEHVIHASQEHVFAFFANPHQRPRWQRSLSSVSVETPGEPRRGTRWRESPTGLGVVSMEITVFDPPHRWAERGVSKAGQLDLLLIFHGEGARTRLVLDAELTLPRLLALGAPLAKPFILREIRHDLACAGRIVEEQERDAESAS